jgi:hypothetical protein
VKVADGCVTASLVSDIIVSDYEKVLEFVETIELLAKVGDVTMKLPT